MPIVSRTTPAAIVRKSVADRRYDYSLPEDLVHLTEAVMVAPTTSLKLAVSIGLGCRVGRVAMRLAASPAGSRMVVVLVGIVVRPNWALCPQDCTPFGA